MGAERALRLGPRVVRFLRFPRLAEKEFLTSKNWRNYWRNDVKMVDIGGKSPFHLIFFGYLVNKFCTGPTGSTGSTF